MTTQTTYPATEKQVAFVTKLIHDGVELAAKVDAVPAASGGVNMLDAIMTSWAAQYEDGRQPSKKSASSTIDALLEAIKMMRPHVPATAKSSAYAAFDALAEKVSAGHYAVESATGHNDLDFYRVVKPTEGKWAGRTFVNRVIGGRPDVGVRGKEAFSALERIAADEGAAQRYGVEIGRCHRCNRHLTDELSRELGIGPECRKVVGA